MNPANAQEPVLETTNAAIARAATLPAADSQRWRVLLLVSLAALMALSVWFSTNAIAPALEREKQLTVANIAWLTIAVQLGFVAGTVVISALNIADLMPTRLLFSLSAVAAGILNLAVIPLDGFAPMLAVRFGTGMLLGGVYPPGMAILSGWFRGGRGIALGVMVGALTLGSGAPHLFRSVFAEQWQYTVAGGSLLAIGAGAIVQWMVADGPYEVKGASFNPRYMLRVLTMRGQRLALLGYLGHMWELYAMWAWIGVYLAAIYGDDAVFGGRLGVASALAFGVFAAGAVASVAAGIAAERIGRTLTTSAAMAASGGIALAIGFVPPAYAPVIAVLALLWGAAVVADSAQFSTAMTELSAARYRGTVLTFQTGIGFALTAVSIRLVPVVAESSGWGWAFAMLAAGPAAGAAAMLRLRSLPEAKRMAGGKR